MIVLQCSRFIRRREDWSFIVQKILQNPKEKKERRIEIPLLSDVYSNTTNNNLCSLHFVIITV